MGGSTKSRLIYIGLLFSVGSLVYGQTTPSTAPNSVRTGNFRGNASFGAPPAFAPQIVTGAPYSGEEMSEQVQTFADGLRITHNNLQRKVYRDSEGRMRTERPLFTGSPMTNVTVDSPIVIEITDPVAGFRYVLDTQNKVAHRQVLRESPARTLPAPQMVGGGGIGMPVSGVMGGIIGSVPSAAPPPPGGQIATLQATGSSQTMIASAAGSAQMPILADRGNQNQMQPRISNESLGTRSIDGVLAEGSRHTITYPVGMMGNDREFSTTTESWTSPELRMMILSKSSDPRSGENTFRIANLSRTPPDPALFLVPSDYTIVDEKGGFTVALGQQ